MRVCSLNEIISMAVKQVAKPAVYIDNELDWDSNSRDMIIWKFVKNSMAEIYEDKSDEFRSVMNGLVGNYLFFFDTEEERNKFYNVFDQPLTSGSSIYACTYSAEGTRKIDNN